MRYHPAVVAQKTATVDLLSDGRFTLGLGAGENLNEHVVGRGWPPANVRHEMLEEAVTIIRALLDGGYVDFAGQHFRVDSAKVWDLPTQPIPIAVAVSGEQSVKTFAPLADHLVAVEPKAELVQMWEPGVPQAPLPQDRPAADLLGHRPRRRASTAPTSCSAGSAAAGRSTPSCPARPASTARPSSSPRDDVADSIPCGPDLDAIVHAVREFEAAGFTDVALVQIGDESQRDFLGVAEKELLPALRG